MENEVSCPITEEPAKEVQRTDNYIEFACPTCGSFKVSRDAYEAIANSETVLRRSALTNAKIRAAETHETPIIGYDDLSII